MRFCLGVAFALLAVASAATLSAQDLAPGAYIIAPLHGNDVTLTWSHHDGGPYFNGRSLYNRRGAKFPRSRNLGSYSKLASHRFPVDANRK